MRKHGGGGRVHWVHFIYLGFQVMSIHNFGDRHLQTTSHPNHAWTLGLGASSDVFCKLFMETIFHNLDRTDTQGRKAHIIAANSLTDDIHIIYIC